MDHATRPYYCPACKDTYPGRAAYLEHPCVARILPYLPTLVDTEEPDKALAEALSELRRWMGAVLPVLAAFARAVEDSTRLLAPVLDHPDFRRYMRARRSSRRNSRALARRTAHR